jgi:hypothetical protein
MMMARADVDLECRGRDDHPEQNKRVREHLARERTESGHPPAENSAMPELTVGTVLFYDAIRGFGFLKCDRGPDVFVSKSELLHSEIKI